MSAATSSPGSHSPIKMTFSLALEKFDDIIKRIGKTISAEADYESRLLGLIKAVKSYKVEFPESHKKNFIKYYDGLYTHLSKIEWRIHIKTLRDYLIKTTTGWEKEINVYSTLDVEDIDVVDLPILYNALKKLISERPTVKTAEIKKPAAKIDKAEQAKKEAAKLAEAAAEKITGKESTPTLNELGLEEVKICPYCQKIIPINDKFCSKCEEPLIK